MSENPPPAAEQPIDPLLVERLLADPVIAGDDDEQALALLFAALRSPAAPHELAERDHYLAAFASAQTLRITAPHSRRKSMLATLLAAKTVAAGIALVSVAGTAAAAYTGSLPSTLQDVAHQRVGAPAANPTQAATPDADQKAGTKPAPTGAASASPSTSGAKNRGPDATGSASYGLCTAFAKGGLKSKSTAHRSLADAAGGPSNIPAFCAAVLQSHAVATPHNRPTGKPTAHPQGKSKTRPAAGKPVTATTAP